MTISPMPWSFPDLRATFSGITNAGASLETCESNAVPTDDHGVVGVTNSVWYSWTAPASGTAVFDTIGSGFDTVLSIYSSTNHPLDLCDPNLIFLEADDNAGGIINTNSPLSSRASFPVVVGTTYYVSVAGNTNIAPTNTSGSVVLNWVLTPPPNDNFTNATVVAGVLGTTNGYNIGATMEPCEPGSVQTGDRGVRAVTNSVWYAWKAPLNEPVKFDTIGSAFDTVLAVYTAATTNSLCGGITLIGADDNSGGLTNPCQPVEQPGEHFGGGGHHLLYFRQPQGAEHQ